MQVDYLVRVNKTMKKYIINYSYLKYDYISYFHVGMQIKLKSRFSSEFLLKIFFNFSFNKLLM